MSHGVCRTTGKFVCNGPNATICNATINSGAASNEVCDDLDNDCDGTVDEIYSDAAASTGAGAVQKYVQPAVIRTATGTWMYQYEASRPDADTAQPRQRQRLALEPAQRCGGRRNARLLKPEQDPVVQRLARRGGANLQRDGRPVV